MNPNRPNSTAQTAQRWLARQPVLAYFVLSYTFFWLVLTLFAVITLGVLRLDPQQFPWLVSAIQIIGSWMPSLAAALIVGVLEGRAGVARLFGKFIRFRMAARWYLVACIPIGLVVVSVSAYRLSGGLPQGGVSLTPAFWVNLVLVNLLTGPTGEEPGWRGFALPRLLQRFSPRKAGLILGVLWSVWHLPVWLSSGYASTTLLSYILVFNIAIIALNLLMTWLYLRVPNILVPMCLIHFTFNFALMLAGPAGLGLGAALPLFTWLAGFTLVTAIVLWAVPGKYGSHTGLTNS